MDMRTDKNLVLKGIKILFGTIACSFLGPTLIYIALGNKEKTLFIPLLIGGIIIAILAIILGFYGIRIIRRALFKS